MDAIEKMERFEAWARVFGLDVQRPEGSGWYTSAATMCAWSGWQAATAALTPPEGWVLMPRVLTEEMLQAGYPADDAQIGYEAMIAARPEVSP